MASTVHLAPVVLTMTGPLLRDGAVAVDGGLVVAVGLREQVLAAHPAARVRDHRGVLTPGLVNAHVHLEYGPGFTDLAGDALRRCRDGMDPAARLVEARGSVHAMLRTGTTCAADVAPVGPAARAARMAGLTLVRASAPVHHCGVEARHGSPVVACTRSDARLQVEPGDGVPAGLGTDSLASSPDHDLLAEARATRDLAILKGAGQAGLAEALVRAATAGGAAALGLTGAGALAPGGRADIAVFDVPTEGDPYEQLVEHGAGRCTATVLGGRLVHRR